LLSRSTRHERIKDQSPRNANERPARGRRASDGRLGIDRASDPITVSRLFEKARDAIGHGEGECQEQNGGQEMAHAPTMDHVRAKQGSMKQKGLPDLCDRAALPAFF
jgi:hypothetical protein